MELYSITGARTNGRSSGATTALPPTIPCNTPPGIVGETHREDRFGALRVTGQGPPVRPESLPREAEPHRSGLRLLSAGRSRSTTVIGWDGRDSEVDRGALPMFGADLIVLALLGQPPEPRATRPRWWRSSARRPPPSAKPSSRWRASATRPRPALRPRASPRIPRSASEPGRYQQDRRQRPDPGIIDPPRLQGRDSRRDRQIARPDAIKDTLTYTARIRCRYTQLETKVNARHSKLVRFLRDVVREISAPPVTDTSEGDSKDRMK